MRDFIYDEAGYGTVNGAKVDLGQVIRAFKSYFEAQQLIRSEQFEHELLTFEGSNVFYKDIIARKVIFCEGYTAFNNPWLAHLPYESAKGEALIIRIPNLKTPDIIKKHFFIVPLENDLFWFGSNYEWEDMTDIPTQIGKEYLVEQLKGILKVEYEIVHHLAAVRPVLKDRRPVIGLHPENANVAVLNGLGTKGTSIAPYCAKALVSFLIENQPIAKEMDVRRFNR